MFAESYDWGKMQTWVENTMYIAMSRQKGMVKR